MAERLGVQPPTQIGLGCATSQQQGTLGWLFNSLGKNASTHPHPLHRVVVIRTGLNTHMEGLEACLANSMC